jgi:hypothetical protein
MRSLPLYTCLFSLLLSCNGEKPSDDIVDTDTDTETDTDEVPECVGDSNCDAWEICEEEVCVDGDRNNAPEEADVVTKDTKYSDFINPAGDLDYFTYTSTGKEWVRIGTITKDVEGGLNTVVTVYRPNGDVLMSMDEFPTGPINGYDSLFHAYLAEAGDWTIKVEDLSTFSGEGTKGNRTFSYDLELKSWSSVTSEEDSLADPSLFLDMESGNTIYGAGVHLEEPGDEDVIRVSLPFDDQPLEVYGIYNLPGSDASPRVSLYDDALNLIAQKDNVGPDGSVNYLFAKKTEYKVVATDVAAGGGDNHWFVLYIRTRAETSTRNQRELEPNDISADATVIEQTTTTDQSPNYDKGYIRGELLADGDEDWFSMEASPGGTLDLYCGSESYGAMGDLAVDIHGPDGTLIQTITEGGDSTPDVEALGPLEAGTHSFRFYSEDGMYGLGVFYRCGLFMYPAE